MKQGPLVKEQWLPKPKFFILYPAWIDNYQSVQVAKRMKNTIYNGEAAH
jgi:hypothetical protein